MVQKTITHLLLAGALALSGFAATGCQSRNEGREARDKAIAHSHAASLIQSGEAEVRDGEAEVARGKALKSQNQEASGEALIASGNAKIKSGEAKIKEGKRLQDKAN
jgi:Tfp pilus assembly protein PilX